MSDKPGKIFMNFGPRIDNAYNRGKHAKLQEKIQQTKDAIFIRTHPLPDVLKKLLEAGEGDKMITRRCLGNLGFTKGQIKKLFSDGDPTKLRDSEQYLKYGFRLW